MMWGSSYDGISLVHVLGGFLLVFRVTTVFMDAVKVVAGFWFVTALNIFKPPTAYRAFSL